MLNKTILSIEMRKSSVELLKEKVKGINLGESKSSKRLSSVEFKRRAKEVRDTFTDEDLSRLRSRCIA